MRKVGKERPQIRSNKTLTALPGRFIPTVALNLVPRYVSKTPMAKSVRAKNTASVPT